MRVWLDCSALNDWSLNHLTGIQRTVLGIYKGLRSLGVEPRLFRYAQEYGMFIELTPNELPVLIRVNMESSEWTSALCQSGSSAEPKERDGREEEVESVTPITTKKLSSAKGLLKRVIGDDITAHELRESIAASSLAFWHVREKGKAWVKARLGITKPLEARKEGTAKITEQCLEHEGEIAHNGFELQINSNDYIFSLGSECYQMPECMAAGMRLKARGAKLIRMVYDVIPISQPQWVSEEATTMFRAALIDLLRQSDYLLTISAHSRSEILDFAKEAGVHTPPIQVVRLGDAITRIADRAIRVPKQGCLPAKPFLLCIGTIEPRKNHRLLYEAWRSIAMDHSVDCPNLVCIGAHHDMCRQVIREMEEDPLVKGRIWLLNGVSDEEVEWYYDNCIATVFPSIYEGWGLPVAESLVRGRLCLASNATSIPEISDLPVFFSPENPSQLRELVLRAVRDREWRRSIEIEIRKRFIPTEWASTARQVLAATETLKESR